MEFKVKCEPIEKLECKDDVTYRPNELSLSAEFIYPPSTHKKNLSDLINKSFGMRTPNFLIMCNFLTMIFDGEDHKLISFDDSTWSNPWIPCNLGLPIVTSLGRCLVHSITIDDDRASIDSTPKYFFDEPKKILKIILLEVENQKFYQISQNVIIGIANDLPSTLIIHPFEIKNN